METLNITSPACRQHEMGSWHPECPERLDAINDHLLSSGIMTFLDVLDRPRVATEAEILRVHKPEYLAHLKAVSPASGYFAIDGDTAMNAHTLTAAFEAAGAGIEAVDAVLAGGGPASVCHWRPPRPPAGAGRGRGVRFFHNW